MIKFLAKLIGWGDNVRDFGSKPKDRVSEWTRATGVDPGEKARQDLMNKAKYDLNLEQERIRASVNSHNPDTEKKAA